MIVPNIVRHKEAQNVEIGISVGIAIYPVDALDANALVNIADTAMYWARQKGNNFQFYSTQFETV